MYGTSIDNYLLGVPLPGRDLKTVYVKIDGGVTAVRSFDNDELIIASTGVRAFTGARGAILLFDGDLVLRKAIDTQWYYHSMDFSHDRSMIVGATRGRVEWIPVSFD